VEVIFDWEFNNFEIYQNFDGKSDVVHRLVWRLSAKLANLHDEMYGTADILRSPSADFIKFQNLTKEDVIQWVEKCLGNDQIDLMKSILSDNLNTAINSKSVSTSAPWDGKNG
jgi:hypothetical protein